MPSVIGSVVQVDAHLDASSTSVTVPVGAEAALAFFSFWDAANGSALASLTLGGISMTDELDTLKPEQLEVNGDAPGVGIELLSTSMPAPGSRTLAWGWTGSGDTDEGGLMLLVFLSAINTSTPFRDFGLAQGIGSATVETGINCAATDLVLAMGQKLSAAVSFSTANVAETLVNDVTLNNETYDLARLVAVNGELDVGISSPDYSSLAVISLPAAPFAANDSLTAFHGTGMGYW